MKFVINKVITRVAIDSYVCGGTTYVGMNILECLKEALDKISNLKTYPEALYFKIEVSDKPI